MLRPRNVFPDVLPLPIAKRKCQKHVLGAEALGGENTCCEGSEGVLRVSQGELVMAGRRCKLLVWKETAVTGLRELEGLSPARAAAASGARET